MRRISEIDPNMLFESSLRKEQVRIYDVCEKPFQIYGLLLPQGPEDTFRRLPRDVAESVSEGVLWLHAQTAGGRVRFMTNSSYIGIYAQMGYVYRAPHMPLSGTAGFDLYRTVDGKQRYIHSFIPPVTLDENQSYSCDYTIPFTGMQEYTLNFPSYSEVKRLYIVLEDSAQVTEASGYSNSLPIVYYGSSITQGACATRPGMSYQNILSRENNWDYTNLGFSGNARGEQTMAEYINTLPMCAFVMDYDYNAPTIEHLQATHAPFFQTIRNAHPELPIICVSKIFPRTEQDTARREIIHSTVKQARENGDTNVWFVDGGQFESEELGTDGIVVDGCHPNDLGFLTMAKGIGAALNQALAGVMFD